MTLLLLSVGLSYAEDVVVTSNLEGAAIYLNGVDTGEVTPATLTGVKPGPVRVSVREGCVAGEANIKVVAGQTAKVSLFALEQGGTILVKASPTGVAVTLDGKAMAKVGQKVEVACGEHTVQGTLAGHGPETVEFTIAANEHLDIPLALKKAELATLELSVQPRTATMLLDGKEVGSDTVILPSVVPGTHTIAAEYVGYQSVTANVNLGGGDDAAWHFELVRNATKTKSSVTQIRGPDRSKPAVAELEDEGEDEDEPDDRDARDDDEDDAEDDDEDAGSGTPYYARGTAKEEDDEDEREDEREDLEDLDEPAATSSRSSGSKSSKSGSTNPYASRDDAADDEDEDLDEEPEDEEEPEEEEDRYADLDEEPSRATTDRSSSSTTRVEKDGGSKAPLRIAGGVLTGLGVVGGGGSVYLFDLANTAHDAWVAKDDAARESGDKALKAKADQYYEDVFVPRATLFYAGVAGSAALLGTGVVLFVVDAPVAPIVVPGGGAGLAWHGSF